MPVHSDSQHQHKGKSRGKARATEKLPANAAARQCMRFFLLGLGHRNTVCDGLAFTLKLLPPTAHYSSAGRTSSLVGHKDATLSSASGPASFFESSALSWLENRESASASAAPTSMLPSISTSQLLASAESPVARASATPEASSSSPSTPSTPWTSRIRSAKNYRTSKVKRVIDASTIQLEQGGYVALDAVRGAGGTYQLPDCMDRAPSYKLKQLLPKGTPVRYVSLDGGAAAAATPRVWLIREGDDLLINQELVRTGFAFVRKGATLPPGMADDLLRLERAAKDQGLGIYKVCAVDASASDDAAPSARDFVAEFEPLDYTTETRYSDDGGTQVRVPRPLSPVAPPPDPRAAPRPVRRVRGCADFRTYEEALGWFEAYAPYYGDVAGLDRDGDGVPCPGLPHTTAAERYRMKVPKTVRGAK